MVDQRIQKLANVIVEYSLAVKPGEKMDPLRYPLLVSSNHRFLVDQDGRPFLIHGDAAWSLITAVSEQEAQHYLADRAARGFNALIVNLIEHKFNGPLTRTGEAPFLDPLDLTTPNPRYFEYAAWVIEQAARLGIVVFLAPAFLGYFNNPRSDDGWVDLIRRAGPEKWNRYGRYIGQQLGRFKNIVWLIGCDRNSLGIEEEIHSLVMGIKKFDPTNLFTAQPAPEEKTIDWYGGTAHGGWLDLNTVYSYATVHKRVAEEFGRKPVMPFVLIESTYEGEHNATPLQIRRQAYWAILNGACGQFMGNNPIWLFNPGWKEALDLPGSRDMAHLKALFASRGWRHLVPDLKREVVTQGWGELNGLDTLAAARVEDGSCMIAYLPTAREITLNLERMSAKHTRAWWFDPRSGQSTPAGEQPASGMRSFVPPGEGDWCLVIDAAGKVATPPGALVSDF